MFVREDVNPKKLIDYRYTQVPILYLWRFSDETPTDFIKILKKEGRSDTLRTVGITDWRWVRFPLEGLNFRSPYLVNNL